jgi:hypothetical protein
MTMDKEFQKVKRFVLKKRPGARTTMKRGTFVVIDGEGKAVVDPQLLLPPATTVRKAWEYAKHSLWFSNMIEKSNTAFNEERMYNNLAKKERGSYD